MADYSYKQLYARMNTDLRDGDDFTFTPAEKTEALNASIDDEHVYVIERDNTNALVAGKVSYPFPDDWDDVSELQVDYYGDGIGIPMDRSAWDALNGQVYLSRKYAYGLPATKKLIMIGKHKLTSTDQIPRELANYVIALACLNTLELLRMGKTNRFLKNDTTLSELLATANAFDNKVLRLRKALTNRRPIRS